MTEQDLLAAAARRADINWEIFQFWSSVSFAYIGLAFFGARHVNWPIVGFLSVLYTAVSLAVVELASNNLVVLQAYTDDLAALASQGKTVTTATQAWLESSANTNPVPLAIALIGTFFGALGYLPYNYWRQLQGGGSSHPIETV